MACEDDQQSDETIGRDSKVTAAIETLVRRFRCEWGSGSEPLIQEYMDQCPAREGPTERRQMLLQLLRIEVQYRRGSARGVRAEDGLPVDSATATHHDWSTIADWTVLERYVLQFPELGTVDQLVDELGTTEGTGNGLADDATQQTLTFQVRAPTGNQAGVSNVPEAKKAAEEAPAGNGSEESPANVLGDYELLGQLGRGGMGIVYRARQRSADRIVALKVIRPDRLAGLPSEVREHAIERFEIEARGTARLDHDNIVTVYEIGQVEGMPFYSMRYVEGQSMAELLHDGPLENRRAARYLLQVARALEAAHEANILHRDVKPRNVLVDSRSDRALLADFGLAKLMVAERDVTMSGEVFGSPPYMSPEQTLDSSKVTLAADIYSLGATLYHAVVGRPPFQASTTTETLRQVIEGEPIAPRQVNRAIDRDLETICLKCLEKDPRQRYVSASALAEDLQRYLDDQPIKARPVGPVGRLHRWARRNRTVAALATTAILLLIAVAVVAMVGYVSTSTALRRESKAVERESIARREEEKQRRVAQEREREARQLAANLLVNEVRQLRGARSVGWTWKGLDNLKQAITFQGADMDAARLRGEAAACLAGADLHELGRIVQGKTPFCVAFSPDSRQLAITQYKAQAYVFPCKVWVVDVESQKIQTLSFRPGVCWRGGSVVQDGGRALAFSPDGRWLVVGTRSGNLFRWDRAKKTPDPIGQKVHDATILRLQFSPDGASCYSSSEDRTLARWDVNGGWKEAARYQADAVVYFALSPDGERVICNDSQVRELDPVSLKVVNNHDVHDVDEVEFIDNGPILACVSDDRIALVDERTGRVIRRIPDPVSESSIDANVSRLDVSPNGLFAVTAGSDRKIKLWDLVAGKLVLTELLGGASVAFPVFSPNGRYLASTGPDFVVLYETRCGNCLTSIAPQPYPLEAFAFSADHEYLACIATDRNARRTALTLWEPNGRTRVAHWPLPGRFDADVRFSVSFDPKEPRLAFTSPSGSLGICSLDPPSEPRYVDRIGGMRFAFAGSEQGLWAIVDECRVAGWDAPDFAPRGRWDNSVSRMLSGHTQVTDMAPGRDAIFAGSENGLATLLDARDASVRTAWHADGKPVTAVGISNDDALVVMGTQNGHVFVVRVADEKILADARLHHDRVTALAFQADGQWLASGARDGGIILWQKQTDRFLPVLTLHEHSAPIEMLQFTPDGLKLAVAVKDEWGVRLWRLDQLEKGLATLGLDMGRKDRSSR